MDSPKQPTPPDPTKTANAQFGYTKDTLNYLSGLNAPNINTPFGSVSYDKNAQGAVTGQNVSLNPQDQQVLDAQRGVSQGLLNQAGSYINQLPNTKFSLGDLGVAVPGTQDYGAYGDQIAHASFDKARGLLDPVFQQQEGTLNQSLADRGQPLTGEGAGRELGNFYRARNGAYTDAANNALLTSGQEMQRLSGIQNQDFNTALGANLTERGQPLAELQGLLGTAPQSPYQNQQPTANLNAAPPDYAGAVNTNYQGLLNNYNSQMDAYSGMWGNVGKLLGQGANLAFGPGGFAR